MCEFLQESKQLAYFNSVITLQEKYHYNSNILSSSQFKISISGPE